MTLEIDSKTKFLSREEIGKLLGNTRKLKNHIRDLAMLTFLLCYRHGLRASELRELKWEHVSFEREDIFIYRKKHGVNGTHTLRKDEVALLKKVQRQQRNRVHVISYDNGKQPSIRTIQYWFEYCTPSDTVRNIHSLRHSCAVHLLQGDGTKRYDVSEVQKWLGHSSILSTTHYLTAVAKDSSDVLV